MAPRVGTVLRRTGNRQSGVGSQGDFRLGLPKPDGGSPNFSMIGGSPRMEFPLGLPLPLKQSFPAGQRLA